MHNWEENKPPAREPDARTAAEKKVDRELLRFQCLLAGAAILAAAVLWFTAR